MKTARSFGLSLACVLGACATSGGSPGAPEQPPRLKPVTQELPGIVGLPSACGLVVVGNQGELHFRMELAGDKVGLPLGEAGSSQAFVVDGLRVQVASIPGNQISPAARELAGIDLLRTHARFECARLSESLGRDVKSEEIEILTSHEMPSGLLWWISGGQVDEDAPAPESEPGGRDPGDGAAAPQATGTSAAGASPSRPTGLAYMTAAYGNRVLVLSVQGLRGERKSALLAKAKAWMATLTTSPRAISASQTSADLEAAQAAGQACPGRPNAIIEAAPPAPQSPQ